MNWFKLCHLIDFNKFGNTLNTLSQARQTKIILICLCQAYNRQFEFRNHKQGKLMNFIKYCILTTILLSLSGCLSYKGYVDPNYEQASLDEIQEVENPHKIRIKTEFLVNGEPQPDAQNEIDLLVNDVFVKSGVVFPSRASDRIINITINNVGSTGAAATKGVVTGLTLGAVGAAVQDKYEVDIVLSNAAGEELTNNSYTQVLHSTIGNKGAPIKGATPYKDGTKAFQKILENVIFSFIKDMQAINELTILFTESPEQYNS